MTQITLTKGGYEEHHGVVKKQMNAGWLTLDIVTCVIPVALCIPILVDALTGAWYDVENHYTASLKPGTRVEFGIAQGRRGDQALSVRILEAPASVSRNRAAARRKKPEEMVSIVEDLIRLLDGVGETYRHGRHPEAKTARPTAKLLRALADELEL